MEQRVNVKTRVATQIDPREAPLARANAACVAVTESMRAGSG